jgi:hypothetical protein
MLATLQWKETILATRDNAYVSGFPLGSCDHNNLMGDPKMEIKHTIWKQMIIICTDTLEQNMVFPPLVSQVGS